VSIDPGPWTTKSLRPVVSHAMSGSTHHQRIMTENSHRKYHSCYEGPRSVGALPRATTPLNALRPSHGVLDAMRHHATERLRLLSCTGWHHGTLVSAIRCIRHLRRPGYRIKPW